jgi:hypothetical protein
MEKEYTVKSTTFAFRALGLILVSAFGVVLLASCEHDKDGNQVVTSLTPTAASPSGSSSKPTTGNWTGTSGSERQKSTLTLNESEGAVSGTLKWPHQTQSVTGTHSGALVRVQISCGDTWRLSYSGTKLTGTGYQENGDTYGINFKRE